MAATALIPETQFDPLIEYGKLRVGMEVMMSTDQYGTHPGWATICGIEGTSIHLWFAAMDSSLGARAGHLEDCWLIDDPRVKNQGHLVNPEMRRAVFWLSDNQVKFNEYDQQIAAATEALESMIHRNKAVENQLETLTAEVKKLQAMSKAK